MATCRPSSDESEDSQVAFDDVIADYSQDRCLPDTQPIEIETPHVMEATDPTPVAWGFLTRLTPNFYSNIALIKVIFYNRSYCDHILQGLIHGRLLNTSTLKLGVYCY